MKSTLIVKIEGAAGAGKTTLADKIRDALAGEYDFETVEVREQDMTDGLVDVLLVTHKTDKPKHSEDVF